MKDTIIKIKEFLKWTSIQALSEDADEFHFTNGEHWLEYTEAGWACDTLESTSAWGIGGETNAARLTNRIKAIDRRLRISKSAMAKAVALDKKERKHKRNVMLVSERHEDGTIEVHEACDARKASIILREAYEVVSPPREVVEAFVRANDQGENLLGED